MSKSNEYEIRAAVVTKLMAQGVEKKHIRIEIPLDTNSSNGRADIVLLCNNKLGCIELKSGKDKVERAAINEQLRPYKRAFDYVGVIACSSHAEKDKDMPHATLYHFRDEEIIGSLPWRYNPHILDAPIVSNFMSIGKYGKTSVPDMLHLLWAREVADILGRKSVARGSTLSHWAETKALCDIRPLVINVLLNRPLNLWEQTFWDRFEGVKRES